jgi:FlaG/FlaF family flagellin (archaellin)
MLIAGLVCLCAAIASAAFGIWSLSHTPTTDAAQLALRSMAPTQFAAAVMLGAGGVVAMAASPHTALVVMIVCILGALGTLATGSLQSAKYALRQEAAHADQRGCAGSCSACTLSCQSAAG